MSGVMQIELQGGGVALIDREDWRHVRGYAWRLKKTARYEYAEATTDDGSVLLMHRLLTDARKGQMVDHINKRRLDNRRNNLRICTRSNIQQRRLVNSNSASGKRGVMAEKCPSGSVRYRAVVVLDGKSHRKWFRCPNAADAWAKQKRLELFGEFAK